MLEPLESLPFTILALLGAVILFYIYLLLKVVLEKETRDRFLGLFFKFEDEDLLKPDSYKIKHPKYRDLSPKVMENNKLEYNSPITRN